MHYRCPLATMDTKLIEASSEIDVSIFDGSV